MKRYRYGKSKIFALLFLLIWQEKQISLLLETFYEVVPAEFVLPKAFGKKT